MAHFWFPRQWWYSWMPGTPGSVESSGEDFCVLGTLCPFRSKSPVTEVTPLRVTAGHHTNGTRRAENVIVLQPDSWRYSRNYGYLVSRQRSNSPRGLHIWRRQNYAKYEISMSYGNIQAKNPHEDKVIRANHENGLQQHPLFIKLVLEVFYHKP